MGKKIWATRVGVTNFEIIYLGRRVICRAMYKFTFLTEGFSLGGQHKESTKR